MIAPRSHRDRAVPDGRAAEISRTAGWISPVLVVDGQVAGVWEHLVRGGAATITVRSFAPVPVGVRNAAQRHAVRYGPFLDAGEVLLDWT